MSGLEILAGAAMGLEIFGGLSQGAEDKRTAEFNARQAELDAAHAAQNAAVEAELNQEDAERAIGSAIVAAASSGMTVEGSAVNVLADLAGQKRYNTRAIIYQGDYERRRLLAEAGNYRRQGQAAMRNAWLGAASTVIGGTYRMAASRQLAGGGGLRKPGSTTSTPPAGTRVETAKIGGPL